MPDTPDNQIVTDEDRAFMTQFLRTMRENGNVNPLLPMDVDVDGDGVVDSFGLDANGELIVVYGVKLEDTLYESTGD